ncbi:hypothetical protein ILYODFUR_033694 [Ilyodon furcidens]|uniref:Stress-associated endoplasmic reticulum protein n=1 Tax=Ilyodon furcidens TaxID=33524 RepID=A0ABV0UP86_9TELE
MSAVQRMKVANERHSKTITQRGHVQKTSSLRQLWVSRPVLSAVTTSISNHSRTCSGVEAMGPTAEDVTMQRLVLER